MDKVENENFSFWYSCFFYFSLLIKAVNKIANPFFKGGVGMSLLKIKRLSQFYCFIILAFLLLTPVSAFSEYALYLDGNSRVDLGSSTWVPYPVGSVEASIKPNELSGLNYIFSSGGSWNGANLVSLVFTENNISFYSKGYYPEGKAFTADYILPLDKFSYIAVTYYMASNDVHIYVNGIEISNTMTIAPMPFPYFTNIGNLSEWSDTGYGMDGYLDSVVVSPYPKSAAEIAATAENGLDCGSSSVGCWLFEEGSGSAVIDSSGNNHSGTLSGSGYGYSIASAPGGSASAFAFGESGGSGSGSGASAAFSPVGDASGLVSGVGAAVMGVGSLLSIMAAYSAVKGIFGG